MQGTLAEFRRRGSTRRRSRSYRDRLERQAIADLRSGSAPGAFSRLRPSLQGTAARNLENAKVRPILGLMEPRSRIETKSEVGPQRSRSVRNVVRPIPDNNPRPIYWRDRLVATPMVQHHIVIYPGHAPPLQAANHSLELRSEARKIVGVLTSAEGLLWVQAVRKIRLCYDSPIKSSEGAPDGNSCRRASWLTATRCSSVSGRRAGRHERLNGSAPAVALGDGPVSFTQANGSITPRRGFVRDNSVLSRK